MATAREKVLSLAGNRKYRLKPALCNGIGETQRPGSNETLRIYINVSAREIITEAGYEVIAGADLTLRACAAAGVMLLKNKPVLAGYTVSRKMIAEQLSNNGSLNQEHLHFALMAELSLKKAILGYVAQKKRPE